MNTPFHRFVLVLAVLGLAGCSTVGTRIREKSAVFATLAPNVQQEIRKGQVEPGFTPDMVYMALGAPDERREHHTVKGDRELWIYLSISEDWQGEVVRYRYYAVRDPKTGAVYVVTEPVIHNLYSTDARERIRVEFTNGKVSSIERDKPRP